MGIWFSSRISFKKIKIVDAQMHGGRRLIAIGHHSDSGDLDAATFLDYLSLTGVKYPSLGLISSSEIRADDVLVVHNNTVSSYKMFDPSFR